MKRTKLFSSTLLVLLLAACNRQEPLFDSPIHHQAQGGIGKSQLRKENANSEYGKGMIKISGTVTGKTGLTNSSTLEITEVV